MIELGLLTPAERSARGFRFLPAFLDGIAFFDDKHKKVKPSFDSKIEYRIRRNALGKAASAADGGVLPAAAPTSAQIVSDIQGLPKVLEKIIEARGCVVPDEFTRGGRRARRADDTGDLTSRWRNRQRKETHVYPHLHPDCAHALAILEVGCMEEMEDAVDDGEAEEHEPGGCDAATAEGEIEG